MNRHVQSVLKLSTGIALVLCAASTASAQVAPAWGAAQSFAVLGGSTVTNTGATTITGDLGLSPGSAVTGFPPGVVVLGTINAANAPALAAQNAVTTVYNNLAGQACTQDLTGQNLGGLTLTPGVYCFSAAAQLTGTLTLNAQNNANAVFIFRIGSSLTTASGSSVVIINSASGSTVCNIFWQVGSSATIGTTSAMAGNIVALTSVTLTTGASVSGRVFARNGAVTLDSNSVTPSCLTAPVCPVITLSPATLPNGMVGAAYSQALTASGGAAPYTYTVTAGALPAGLSLTAGGLLSGTPTAAGTSSVTIRATDANGCSVSVVYSIVIAPVAACPVITLSPATLPNGIVGVAYSRTITASGGAAPYVFTLTAGALPAGMTLTAGGVLSGTPTTAATTNSTIRATDANGCFASLVYTVVIAPAAVCPVITLTPATMPNGMIGAPYSQAIIASGGQAPYTFTQISGTLPTGITLSAAGVLAGTPTTAQTAIFAVRATDANGCVAEINYTIVIAAAGVCPVVTVSPAVLPSGMVGTPYSQPITASGGLAPYTYTVTIGTLPTGLTLSAAGLLSGTPTAVGTSAVTIRGTDANGCFASTAYSIVIAAAGVCPVITLSPATLPLGTVGAAYSQTLTAAGGTAPYVYTITAGALPTGMTLSPTGVLSGTPTIAGTSTPTIRATDANGCFVSVTLSIVIASAVPTMSEWFMILLTLIIIGTGYRQLRRRATVQA